MRIAFLQPWDSCRPPDVGGSLGIWTWEVARRLARSHEVLVCSRRLRGAPAFERIEGITFCRFFTDVDAKLLRLSEHIRRNPRVPDFASELYCYLYLLRAAAMIRKHSCDVVHIFNLSQFVPLVARFNPHSTIVLNMHCDWLGSLDYPRVNARLRKVDWIVGCANYVTDEIRHRFPHYADRCETIYNGVDVDRFEPRKQQLDPRPRTQTLLTVGRISPEKGLHVLLDALEIVLSQKIPVRLRIIGPESILPPRAITKKEANLHFGEVLRSYRHEYLRRLQERLTGSLAESVSFVGALPHARIATEMRNATILAQPSLYDLSPLPVLEGMTVGLPIVASRVGGLAEIVVHGETGLLVEPGNSVQLAAALMTLLDDCGRARAMGIAGRKRALDMFSWDTIVSKLNAGYEANLGSVKPNPSRIP